MTKRQLEVETKIPGGLLGAPERLILEFPLQETISIRRLIRLKVEEEARRLAAMETLKRPAQHVSMGREYRDIEIGAAPCALDISAEVRKAQQAFEAGRFLILANGQRYNGIGRSL